MSTLQTANVWFESTGNNRIQSSGSNGVTIFAGGSNVVSVNTTAVSVGNLVLSNVSSILVGNSTVNTVVNSSTVSIGGVSVNTASLNPYQGMKNRIINGDMVVDQRYAGAATANTIAGYTVDRWALLQTTTGKLVGQQNRGGVSPPSGFSTYFGVTSQSAYSVSASDYYVLRQYIEGYNIRDFAFGTASAQSITLSFWVRSSLTGPFGVQIYNSDGTRIYRTSYTINSANTWEYKTITIPGCTDGTWGSVNSYGLSVGFGLGYGSSGTTSTGNAWLTDGVSYGMLSGMTSVVGTSGATWYITGVQVEVGSNATLFDRRPYATELALCQRYYEFMTTCASYSGGYYYNGFFKATKRANPTVTPSITPTNLIVDTQSFYFTYGSVTGFTWTASAEL